VRFSLLSSLLVLFFPFTAQSLGLGEISITSSLNTPLDAKIQLESATSQDLESLDIKLASDKDFARSDIDKVDLLKRIKFNLIENDGSPYIHVTSKSILREPFINFLIDIQWYSGRILREYTLFIDPPEATNINLNKDSSTTKRSSTTAAKFTPATSPAKNSYQQNTNKSTNNNQLATSLTYGPTTDTDTLWSVATKMRKNSGVGIGQLMMAIQRENPQAFYEKNINGLMPGYTLKISESSLLSKSDARALVEQQHKQWKQIISKNIANKVDNIQSSTADPDGKIAKLKLLSSDVMDEAKNDVEDDAEEISDSNKSSITLAKIEAKLALYEERIQSQTQENEELKRHIKDLVKLLEKNESLVSLKDENLSILQEKNKLEKESDTQPQETKTQEKLIEIAEEEKIDSEISPPSELTSQAINKTDKYVFNEDSFIKEIPDEGSEDDKVLEQGDVASDTVTNVADKTESIEQQAEVEDVVKDTVKDIVKDIVKDVKDIEEISSEQKFQNVKNTQKNQNTITPDHIDHKQ